MQKAINVEIKMSLKSSAMVRDLDAHCPKGHCFSYITLAKVQIQGFKIKKSKLEEYKSKKSKPAKDKTPVSPRSKSTEPKKTSCIDKQREYLKKKCNQKNNTIAIGDNANVVKAGEKKRND